MANLHSQNIIGEALKRARRGKKLTQTTLAARCSIIGWDISQNTITKIESGFRCVTDYELITLARALKVGISDLIPDKVDIQSYLQKRCPRNSAEVAGDGHMPISSQ